MTTKLFSELGVSAEILKAVERMGFEQASPIQAETIPVLMQGKDIVGQSQTGSGKTAAFAIPAIEKVDVTKRVVQILVLCPTRELAVQVCEEFFKLSLFKRGIHALPIYGGQSYDRQISGLRQGAQIVIGTPGRVMDHMRRGTLVLDNVKMMILDEADVMLDMGFREDIEFILQSVPKERQTVFFSATMPRPIQNLIQTYARDPQSLRIEQKALTVSTTEQTYYEVDRRFKVELLTRLIDLHDLKLGIIFCNTKRMVDDLVDHLNIQGYSADRLHGDMTQAMRDRVMNKFRKSGMEFLVATDVAARGIDVDDVQVVFNYDLPYDPEDYVHRIGRTGRAGKSGRAISFVAGREMFQINHIERYTNMKIQRGRVPTLDEVEEVRANTFLEKVRVTLQSGEYERKDHLVERLLEEGFSSTDIASALIHHLQIGEGTPAPAKAQREDEYSRPERNERRDDRREDRRSYNRYDSRPSYASGPRESRYESRPSFQRDDVRPKPRKHDDYGNIQHTANRDTPPAEAGTPTQDRPPLRPSAAPRSHAPAAAAKPHATPATAPVKPAAAPKAAAPEVQPESKPNVAPVSAPVIPKAKEPAAPAPQAPAPATPKSKPVISTFPSGPRAPLAPSTVQKRKASRATPKGQTRLYMNIGEEMGITPGDIVGAILGETGLPAKTVGTVDIRERHLFVDVAAEHTNAVISKLNRAHIKSHKVKVKVA